MVKFFICSAHSHYLFRAIGWLLIVPLFYSCSANRSVTYFRDNSATDAKRYAALASIEQIPLRIQADDILAIIVNSLSEQSNALFNSINSTAVNATHFPGGLSASGGQPLGFSVDQNGEVNLPLGGKVKLAGMTLKEADIALKAHLSQFIKDPSVDVRLMNHKFTVIGEVSRPGIYNLLENRTTLPEVLGIAGDLTLYGRRTNVMVMRTVNNKREIIKLDLTSRQVLSSPYYFIENNDVVYVEAKPSKSTFTDRTLQLVPTTLALITTTLLLYNTFLKK